MKYAVHYYKDFRYFDTVDEVIFDSLKGDESIVENIPKIIKEDWQKAIINITMIEDISTVIPYLNQLKTIHNNFIVQITWFKPDRKQIIQILNDNEIPFMFIDFPHTLEQVWAMAEMGAKEIYITEELGFHLKEFQSIRENFGVLFRVFPDVAQCSRGTSDLVPAIKKFWIRPEDTEIYEDYVDVFELFKIDSKLSVTYEIYKQRQWSGPIENLISSWDKQPLDNLTIAPYFGTWRLDCKKKCLLGKCNLCDRIYELAEGFNKADVVIEKEQDEEYKNELKQKLYNKFMQTEQTKTQDESN